MITSVGSLREVPSSPCRVGGPLLRRADYITSDYDERAHKGTIKLDLYSAGPGWTSTPPGRLDLLLLHDARLSWYCQAGRHTMIPRRRAQADPTPW